MDKKKIDGQDLLRKNPSFYQKKEIENRLDIEEISTKKSFPFFLIRQDASSQENWTINIYGYTRVGGVDWRLVKKNAFRLRHLAAVVSTALQPPFWHRRAISEFLTEISISGLLLARLFCLWLYICIPKCHMQPWNPFVFVVVVAHAVALCIAPPSNDNNEEEETQLSRRFTKLWHFLRLFWHGGQRCCFS